MHLSQTALDAYCNPPHSQRGAKLRANVSKLPTIDIIPGSKVIFSANCCLLSSVPKWPNVQSQAHHSLRQTYCELLHGVM